LGLTRLGCGNGKLGRAGGLALVVLEEGRVDACKLAQAVDGARAHTSLTRGDVHLEAGTVGS